MNKDDPRRVVVFIMDTVDGAAHYSVWKTQIHLGRIIAGMGNSNGFWDIPHMPHYRRSPLEDLPEVLS